MWGTRGKPLLLRGRRLSSLLGSWSGSVLGLEEPQVKGAGAVEPRAGLIGGPGLDWWSGPVSSIKVSGRKQRVLGGYRRMLG